mgnify:CR=1 FL=1
MHMQAMMGGLAGGGGGGGGMMQIEVTPEDEEAISRLMDQGLMRAGGMRYPRDVAIQALLFTMQCIMQRALSAYCTRRHTSHDTCITHLRSHTAGLHGLRQRRECRYQLPLGPRKRGPRVERVLLCGAGEWGGWGVGWKRVHMRGVCSKRGSTR